jgi:hypothetical protein
VWYKATRDILSTNLDRIQLGDLIVSAHSKDRSGKQVVVHCEPNPESRTWGAFVEQNLTQHTTGVGHSCTWFAVDDAKTKVKGPTKWTPLSLSHAHTHLLSLSLSQYIHRRSQYTQVSHNRAFLQEKADLPHN